jgi:hypothetical protein
MVPERAGRRRLPTSEFGSRRTDLRQLAVAARGRRARSSYGQRAPCPSPQVPMDPPPQSSALRLRIGGTPICPAAPRTFSVFSLEFGERPCAGGASSAPAFRPRELRAPRADPPPCAQR